MAREITSATIEFADGSILSLELNKDAHFIGFKKTDLICLTYLTPDDTDAEGKPIYNCNGSEYYLPSEIVIAHAAFLHRAMQEKIWKPSVFSRDLNLFMDREG